MIRTGQALECAGKNPSTLPGWYLIDVGRASSRGLPAPSLARSLHEPQMLRPSGRQEAGGCTAFLAGTTHCACAGHGLRLDEHFFYHHVCPNSFGHAHPFASQAGSAHCSMVAWPVHEAASMLHHRPDVCCSACRPTALPLPGMWQHAVVEYGASALGTQLLCRRAAVCKAPAMRHADDTCTPAIASAVRHACAQHRASHMCKQGSGTCRRHG